MCEFVCVGPHVLKEQLFEVGSLLPVGPAAQTQVARLAGKHACPLSISLSPNALTE